MGKRFSWRRLSLSAVLVLAASLSSFSLNAKADAALPKLDQIRVALFIAARGSVPAVTLSSKQGLAVSGNMPSGSRSAATWLTAPAGEDVKFQADGFRIKVAETSTEDAARQVWSKLNAAGYAGYIYENSNGSYEVEAGDYADLSGADSAKDKLSAKLGYRVQVTGPLHLTAGKYATAEAAMNRAAALGKQGIAADLAYTEQSNGQAGYEVWIGEAADASALSALQSEVRQKSGLQVSPAGGGPYLLLRSDVTAGGKPQVHLMFNPDNQKVWVTTPSSGITVKERYGRTYRGAMEISRYKGELALINVLPMPQYLYSVVGTEMQSDWPLEALKAQAVAARTYALANGNKYGIANISDTTYDQAYSGMDRETSSTIRAVNDTQGEVIVDTSGKLITPYYTANAGGLTAAPSEIWGGSSDYLQSVPSPDQSAEKGLLPWYHIVTASGTVAYIRSDFAQNTGETNAAGLPIYVCTEDGVNIRNAPYVNDSGNPPVAKADKGDRFVVFDTVTESNSYHWIRGPWSPSLLLESMSHTLSTPVSGPLQSVEVVSRGPSQRVTAIKVNGKLLELSHADAFRTALNGLPSTRFSVQNTADAAILDGGGTVRRLPESGGGLYVLGGNGQTQAAPVQSSDYFIMNDGRQVRAATHDTQFVFTGYGSGHGAGMSQWGAKAWADLGYDYRKILQYYYKDVRIVKD